MVVISTIQIIPKNQEKKTRYQTEKRTAPKS